MKEILKYIKVLSFSLVITIAMISCEDFLEVPLPNDQLATETVFQSKETIHDLLTGMYNIYAGNLSFGFAFRASAALADEAMFPAPTGSGISNLIIGNLTAENTAIPSWNEIYSSIYRANILIENLPEVPNSILSEPLRKSYMAAARFVRAQCHFFLVNSWGDVPLILTTDAIENADAAKTPADQVYASVINDLELAAADLPEDVIESPTIHNKYQALALLARVYLYTEKWEEAEAAATEVINSGEYLLVTNLQDVFKKGSQESIVYFAESMNNRIALNRVTFAIYLLPYMPAAVNSFSPHIPDHIISMIEPGDQRWLEGNWMTTLFTKPFQNKWRHNLFASDAQIAEYPQNYILIRLSEMYLIRAEARAQQNKIGDAADDLNEVRTRAGLPDTGASDKASMLMAIENERVFELFMENHRWYDLKRTNRLDAVLGTLPYKQENWQSYYRLWPIRETELLVNSNLEQNFGY